MTTADDVACAIARRHGLSKRTSNGLLKGALVREVGINLFADRQHYADALVQEYTGQRRLVGYEIKVDRGDWLRELADLSKAAWWATRCDEWWVATRGD